MLTLESTFPPSLRLVKVQNEQCLTSSSCLLQRDGDGDCPFLPRAEPIFILSLFLLLEKQPVVINLDKKKKKILTTEPFLPWGVNYLFRTQLLCKSAYVFIKQSKTETLTQNGAHCFRWEYHWQWAVKPNSLGSFYSSIQISFQLDCSFNTLFKPVITVLLMISKWK